MGLIAPVLAAGSALFGGVSAAKGASDTKRQYLEAQGQAFKNANYSLSQGDSEAALALGEGSRQAAHQVADTAARGFDVGTVTARDLVDATNLVSSADASVIRENARRKAQGFLEEGDAYGRAAKRTHPFLTGLGTLIGGASSVASAWQTRNISRQYARAGQI
jgi:hypothetical protein